MTHAAISVPYLAMLYHPAVAAVVGLYMFYLSIHVFGHLCRLLIRTVERMPPIAWGTPYICYLERQHETLLQPA